MLKIERLGESHLDSYMDFLSNQDGGLLYYTAGYRQLLSRLLGCGESYLVAREDGQVRGVLPLLFTESPAGRVYNALPYYGSHGGILADSHVAFGALLNSYNEIASAPTTLAATMIENPFAERPLEHIAHTHIDDRIGQFTLLPSTTDPRTEILSRCEASTRRNVRKAASHGVEVDVGATYLEPLRIIHEENLKAIGGMAKSARFFQLVPEIFTEHEDYNVYAACIDGRVIAAVLLFYFGRTVEYYTPAVAEDYRSFQPLSLALIIAMSDAALRGYRYWNWGGTWNTQAGVYRFKRKWGAKERRYHYYTQLNDESLLKRTPAELLAEFPGFFTVPFTALKKGAA